MANKVLQLKRSIVKNTYAEALTALKAALAAGKDGEPIIARYKDGEDEHVILGIVSSNGKYEIWDNAAGNEALKNAIEALDAEVESSNGSFVKVKVTEVDGKITAVAVTETDIAKASDLTQEIADRKAAIEALDYTDTAEDNKFVTEVSEKDGVISVKRAQPTAAGVAATAIDGSATKVAVTGSDVAAQIDSIAQSLKSIQDNAAKYKVVALTADEIAVLSDGANVKEAYKVMSYTGNWDDATDKAQVGETIKVYKDATLKSASFANQTLTLTYVLADGSESVVPIDMSQLVLETEVENGIQAVDHKLSIKLDTNGDDTGDGKFLTVGAEGLKLDGVTDAINAAVERLDVTDTAVEHKFVTAVSETDGKIAVTREQPTAADVAATAIAAGDATVAIAGTDVKTQIENIGKAIKTEENARKTVIEALDDEDDAVAGSVVTAVVQTDGKVGTSTKSQLQAVVLTGFTGNTTKTGDIAAADTLADALNKLQNKANGGLDEVEAGNGITVSTKADKKQTVTAKTVANDPIIEVTASGIGTKEDALFDCGEY